MHNHPSSKKQRTRQFIIKQTAPVFNEKGYAATSLSDLTAVTGLSKGSIYGNFRNKEELALCAFEYNAGAIERSLAEQVRRAETARDKLLAYPLVFRMIYSSVFASGGCPLLNTAVDSSDTNPELRDAVCGRINNWKKALTAIIEQGMENGEFIATGSSAQTAEILICLAEGGYAMSRATADMNYIESSLSEMERIIHTL
ncbi:TetR/AcrR family transcriptional regulator [Desulforhopalus singaporensis]|uniref:Transcriptional regulator, TetR family n=1 Tax=Desulforhopalus singaporensis TaxID=91360 RepID=A0A1H0V4Q6_9BACT|nr:TetR/AcrR family transcriptional regulator [Desulforhopalus singaporensis]SDP73148.1 transcriptional regulator, TetR family [Desulforhopalus singaporensis]